MRILFFILSSILLSACSSKTPLNIEHDIFIASLDRDFDSSGKLILKDTSKTIRFSKDFWNYFIRTHPKSSSMIFISPLYDSRNNYLSFGDTSFTFYNTSHFGAHYFTNLLADSVTGKEKEDALGPAFFVIPNDTTGYAEQHGNIERRLKNYTITPTMQKEFEQFKDILTFQDSSHHYIIVFKRQFADRIFKLYE